MDLLTPLLRKSALAAIFSDEQTVQRMLDFEAALARTQARCDIIPASAVAAIEQACNVQNITLPALAESAADVFSGAVNE